MTKLITIIFSFLTLTTFGQAQNNTIFKKLDYPLTKYTIMADTFGFAGFKIELIHAKLNDYKTYDSTAAYCRIWLTIKKNNTTIDKLFIKDCEALGGCSGIYATNKMIHKDYFILSKFGDYDGRIIIIDTSGKIKSFIGGHFYLSTDSKYLFSPYDADLSGLTVYDFSKNQVLFTSDSISAYLADFYYLNNKYFVVVGNLDKKANLTDIATYDFKTNKLVFSTVENSYITEAIKLKAFNKFTNAPCNCGKTKK